MPDALETNDVPLTANDVGQLENHARIVELFGRLGYDVDEAMALDHAALGMDTEELRHLIHEIWLVATDPDEEIRVYLMEVRSVTVQLKQKLARRFRERSGEILLVLTGDEYESFDFVLLERALAKSKALGQTEKQVIRPRSLTVERRNPAAVALRVLRRFTYTESDYLFQWEKLRSAFTLAEWSEPYFNNRALFSDYYLKNRLTDPSLTPAWTEDVKPVGREAHRLLSDARSRFSGRPEAEIRAGLFEPLLQRLGFDVIKNKDGRSSAEQPDYYLRDPGAAPDGPPLAALLTYVWNRNLDDVDDSRDKDTPGEIPGALVVSVLEQGEAPWVVVSNGKLWRLYAAGADNKATNYYEVDLEEALNAEEQITALKYWWLLFRREAFGSGGFLDSLLQASQDYAKELGARLKDRIFEQIFPHFAAGFIAHARAQDPAALDGDDFLAETFSGTLTFLYRLMFILYAESLELLPVYEARGYREHSLYRLKKEIAEIAGTIRELAPENTGGHYSATASDLYERLQALFKAIDEGRDEWNLPVYNGGLFSPESDEGQFLTRQAIPDRYLALGLDLLARDVDEKSQALALIDYKDLGVRHLGSIYEGLLEFRLRIAAEPLVVVKEKGRERYLPAGEAGSRRVYGEIAPEAVYLENDKRERKATGSYYTPDYIVKYIVEHTVGPVLARKFEALAPRLRDAQRQYRDHVKRVAQRGSDQDPALYWNEPEMVRLADACLDIRTLDPAMGSGHFLVEVVDFTSNRLLTFLNGWSENPVWGMLAQMRRDILADVESQGVSIDAGRLTRVALLKRAVLKRCIYGVDLNAMAVELAKVSLWLDAFTLGAPLSFLDHHLKQGNSLIGARVREVLDALEGKANRPVQMSLFGTSKFAGVMLATELMRQISYLPDNTATQVQESRQAYRAASDHLAPFKRVLDVYTSRWFGNEPSKGGFEPAIEFLQRDDTQAWLENPGGPLSAEDYMNTRRVASNTEKAVRKHHFFHWELEFPEIFFAPGTPDGQDVQLKEDGGFDAVVGNPPYDEVSQFYSGNTDKENAYFTYAEPYSGTKTGRINLYRLFLLILSHLLREEGLGAYIVPLTILSDSFSFGARKRLLETMHLERVEAFPQKDDPKRRVFLEAKQSTAILILRKTLRTDLLTSVRTHPGRDISSDSPAYSTQQRILYAFTPNQHAVPLVSGHEWSILEKRMHPESGLVLKDIASIYAGELCDNRANSHFLSNEPVGPLVLRGGNIQRYELIEDLKQGVPRYLKKALWLKQRANSKRGQHFREKRITFQKGAAVDNWRRLIMTVIPENEFCFDTIGYLPFSECTNPYALLALMNSRLWEFRFSATSTTNHINAYELDIFSVPDFTQGGIGSENNAAVKEAQANYDNRQYTAAFATVSGLISSIELEGVFDVLGYLAQQMLHLNNEKRAATKEFLQWLIHKLRIATENSSQGIETLSGYTIIQNYLGDYQKGEPELPWSEMAYRLYQNRSRFAANWESVKGEVQAEYEQSLATLRPIKQRLAETDALIDKIVYRLYGLTDEEIRLIEQPAYEQALTAARTQVAADKKLQRDPDAAADAVAARVLPAAQRLLQRVEHAAERAALDAALPGWQLYPEPVPTFLLTGEYSIHQLPDHLDFAASVVSYAKAVETMLFHRLFLPFRDEAGKMPGGVTPAEASNKFLRQFLGGERDKLTLGSMQIILASSKEAALRAFAATRFYDAPTRLFGPEGVAALLADDTAVALRNAAAHDQLMTRADAQAARAWAVGILEKL